MKKIVRTVGVVLVLVLCAAAALAQTEPPTLTPMRIKLIKANVPAYLHEVVRIDGFAQQFVDAGMKSTSFYIIKDDLGSFVKILTSQPLPSVGTRFAIVGLVEVDPRTKDLFVSEKTRTELVRIEVGPGMWNWVDVRELQRRQAERQAIEAKRLEEERQLAAAKGRQRLLYVAIGGAAVIILALGLFLAFRSRSNQPSTADYSLASATRVEPPPAPEQVIEGKTIKLHAPPPNTVKLLPGWFEVVSGDDVVKQIRFYKLGGEHGAETTFGRASGRPYAHIQLKAQTVSSRQAKVTFFDGSAQLTNFASNDSNPTKFNGRDLAVNESVPLSESDRVEMGEVSLLFHDAPSAATLIR
jgi:hypothetical protein